jgi:hypothetical protein
VPNRIIRETILTSDRVDQLDAQAEVFYRRLLSKVDDYGRFDARPSILRASLFPLRIDRVREADCSRWIAACDKAGLIVLYSHAGKPYLEVANTGWKARSPSRFPELQASENICAHVQTNARLDVVVDVVVDEDVNTSADADLLSGVSPQIAKDFRALRKAKKAAITQTAVDGIRREAAKAGLTLESALAMCCERGWTGFKADWAGATSAQAAQPGGGRRAL